MYPSEHAQVYRAYITGYTRMKGWYTRGIIIPQNRPLAACVCLFSPCPGVIIGIQYLLLFGAMEDSPELHIAVEILTLTYGLVVLCFG